MKSKRKSRKIWTFAFLGFLTVFFLNGIYCFWQFRELIKAFEYVPTETPTLIYSDLTEIRLSMKRWAVLERLRSLQVRYSINGHKLKWKIPEILFPMELLPEADQGLPYVEGKEVQVEFDSEAPSSPIISIKLDGSDLGRVFLPPKLIARLARTQNGERATLQEHKEFSEIPTEVWKAIIAIEDQHFLSHSGFDPRGILRAFWINLQTLSFSQGGSTITQQLVKNLTGRRSKNIFKKINEVFLAVLLEFKFDKLQILERYLNEVYLGQIGHIEVHGVSEGAKYFFNKEIHQLNTAEIALMVGLIRGPWYYSPYRHFDRAKKRQENVLERMVETGLIANDEAKLTQRLPIRLSPPPKALSAAPYFVDYVKSELQDILKDQDIEEDINTMGLKIYTTLDDLENESAQNAVSKGVERLEGQWKISNPNLLQAAMISSSPESGAIRSIVGGKNPGQSLFNRILNMKRQIGSTFKPIIYLTAFLQEKDSEDLPYGTHYLIEDAPITVSKGNSGRDWTPKNYDPDFLGWISLQKALSESINTAAVRLGLQVGLDAVIETAEKLGVTTPLREYPSLLLGAAELSPQELLSVYNTLAARGTRANLFSVRMILEDNGKTIYQKKSHTQTSFPKDKIDLLNVILQKVFETGTARSAKAYGWTTPAIGKTGTTSDYRDSWFAGATAHRSTVVWVGLDKDPNEEKTTKLPRLTGSSAALPIWVEYMKKAQTLVPPEGGDFPPDELQEVEVNPKTGRMIHAKCGSIDKEKAYYLKEVLPDLEECTQTNDNPHEK